MNAPLIPQANPGAAFRSRRDALLKAAADVLDGGWYINGKQVRQFFRVVCRVLLRETCRRRGQRD